MPLIITVILHIVLIGGAAAIVVQQSDVKKKKVFEASNKDESPTVKQVEHRLQVARRSGAASPANPVSANRIFTTAPDSLQMPALPDLPNMGAGSFGGFSGMGSSGIGLGQTSGMATSLGPGSGLNSRGFMSMSFLGLSALNTSKVVFLVDTSPSMMEPRKGGFRAFTIIREEIMRQVSRLPANAQFNVILFQSGSKNVLNLYRRELCTATSDEKKAFFEWMAPVNSKFESYGPNSAPRLTGWRRKPLPADSGIDPDLGVPHWVAPLQAALECEPETIFLITSGLGGVSKRVSDEEIARRSKALHEAQEKYNEDCIKAGTTSEAVAKARRDAYEKASQELKAANQKLIEQGKQPIVVLDLSDLSRPDVVRELKKHGLSIKIDDSAVPRKKDGTAFKPPQTMVPKSEPASWNELYFHISRLQNALVPKKRAALNIMLFAGPDEKPVEAMEIFTKVADKNGGKFRLLTAKNLEEYSDNPDTAKKSK
jgi:hypothetical protein